MPNYTDTVWSPNHESRDGAAIELLALHSEEPRGDASVDAYRLAGWLRRKQAEASYHVVVDDAHTLGIVPDERACWALRNGNPRSLNLCIAGSKARWTRAQWLEHRPAIARAAAVFREWSASTGVPAVRIGADGVRNRRHGLIDHNDYTIGAQDGDHSDVGPNFPWDVLDSYIHGTAATTPAAVKPAAAARPAPATAAKPRDPSPALLPWSLPRGHYYGNKAGPRESHGGYYGSEQRAVRIIQQAFIALGCVPGVTNWRDGWADGVWEAATDAACRRWYLTCDPRVAQPHPDRLYADDYAVLDTQ